VEEAIKAYFRVTAFAESDPEEQIVILGHQSSS
jgi:hypothetical protein